jgi:hypothetical protein
LQERDVLQENDGDQTTPADRGYACPGTAFRTSYHHRNSTVFVFYLDFSACGATLVNSQRRHDFPQRLGDYRCQLLAWDSSLAPALRKLTITFPVCPSHPTLATSS